MNTLKYISKNIFHFSFYILFAISFTSAPVRSAIINLDTAEGLGADSFISTFPNQINSNFGSDDTFFLKNDLGSGFVNRKGYLRFDLSSIEDPILDVNLALSFVTDTHANFATWGFNVYGLLDGHSGENWLENDINWNNAPANDTSNGGGLLLGQASLLGDFSINTSLLSAGDIVNFNSTALTNFLLDDTDNLSTLILIRQDRTLSNVGFAAKEHSTFAPPTLTLTTQTNAVPVPVPVTIWLFLPALMVVLLRANRKND